MSSSPAQTAGMHMGKTNSLCLHNRAGIMIGRHHHTGGTPATNRMSIPQPVSIPVNMLPQQVVSTASATLPKATDLSTMHACAQQQQHMMATSQSSAQPVLCGTLPSSGGAPPPSIQDLNPAPPNLPTSVHTAPESAVSTLSSNNSSTMPNTPQNTGSNNNNASTTQAGGTGPPPAARQGSWPNHPPPWTSL